jgi:protein SCO1/2
MGKRPHIVRDLLVLLGLCGMIASCKSEQPWHLINVKGTLPPLEFTMQRASDGAIVDAKNYRGQVVLLEFGYTFCPDVCPTTLTDLSHALQKIAAKQGDVSVLFVTVDPDRDKLDLLSQYAASFSPNVEALRGTPDQLAALARRYRAAYEVKPSPDPKDYEVMHTGTVYVFDRSGQIRLLAAHTDDADGLAADLQRLLTEAKG